MTALDSAREAILGLWRLKAYEDRESEHDSWYQPYGRRPIGLGIYAPSGLLSMQVFPAPNSPSEGPHVAYIGTYAVLEAREEPAGFSGVLEHNMESASPPELLAEDAARPFVVVGDTLVLGDGSTWRRTFTRVGGMPRLGA